MPRAEEKTILVVDDEPDVVVYLKTILEDDGFSVVTAGNGNEALEQVRRHRPDFISLDLVMPQKSGIKFFYELRRNREWSRIPVVVVTAHAQDEKVRKDIEELFAGKTVTGPRTYLEKPIKPQDYVNLVRRELGIATHETSETTQNLREEDLRRQVQELVLSSTPEALERALELLKEPRK